MRGKRVQGSGHRGTDVRDYVPYVCVRFVCALFVWGMLDGSDGPDVPGSKYSEGRVEDSIDGLPHRGAGHQSSLCCSKRIRISRHFEICAMNTSFGVGSLFLPGCYTTTDEGGHVTLSLKDGVQTGHAVTVPDLKLSRIHKLYMFHWLSLASGALLITLFCPSCSHRKIDTQRTGDPENPTWKHFLSTVIWSLRPSEDRQFRGRYV